MNIDTTNQVDPTDIQRDLRGRDHFVRNLLTFGPGTIGRDMLYTLVTLYLTFYLTEELVLPDSILLGTTVIIVILRIFDAANDPFMGYIVDNTKTRFGRFKPWIAIGAIAACAFACLFFWDFGLEGSGFLILFTFNYLFWGISFTINDISFWSMLPSLTLDQKKRETIGAVARICANLGLFAIVVAFQPIISLLQDVLPNPRQAYFLLALGVAVLMLLFQCITLFGVKEPDKLFKTEEPTTLKAMRRALFKNDQLMVVAISLALFMIGYTTTTSFGLYFFKYAYKDESMYPSFALILGLAQVAALLLFPLFSHLWPRKKLYTIGTVLVVLGYIIFFFSPMNMIFIGTAGVLLFMGQAFIQLLMLVFLTDTIEYGQWKLGRRNDSITFSIQPFINKVGGAMANGIVGLTVVFAGISQAKTPEDVTPQGLWLMKISMLVLPLICIVVGYIIYRKKYKIDKAFYDQILLDLRNRGDIEQ